MFRDRHGTVIREGDILNLRSGQRKRIVKLDFENNVIHYTEPGNSVVWAGDWRYYEKMVEKAVRAPRTTLFNFAVEQN